jgi:MFS transporter, PPP family, 3-phenylpropionic acid transporter
MTKARINTFRIDANYAAVQGSYCAGFCVLNGFTAVYLIFKGFTNPQIGLTSSLLSIGAILLQILVSNFADANPNIALKKIALILYSVTMAGCAVLWLLPISIAFMVIVYCIASAAQRSIMALINSMMMQFSRMGLPVNYGWPRGVCSILFALSAYILGIVIEKYSPDIIMPVSIGLTVISIISIVLMPNPRKMEFQHQGQFPEEEEAEHTSSYLEMVRSNPTLVLFMCASFALSLGQSTAGVFLIRIIEAVGGSTKDFGTCMLIQAGIEFPMMFASARLLNNFKIQDLLVFSFFCYCLKQFGLAVAPSVGSMYWVMTFSLFCMGIYGFASVLFINSVVKSSEIVRAQTIAVLAQSIGQIVGSYLSGALIDIVGLKSLLMIGLIILLMSAGLMLACNRVYVRQFSGKTPYRGS